MSAMLLQTPAAAAAAVFVSRHPIFDRRKNVFGYELQYRVPEQANSQTTNARDLADRRISHQFSNAIALSELTGQKKAFVSFTRDLLINHDRQALPPNLCVVELLEAIEPDEAILNACRAIKSAGNLLAMDDFVLAPKYQPLLALADIVKIDFLASDTAKRKSVAEDFGGGKFQLLAEKVERHEDFEEAVRLGYTYFQGYFFCKPQAVPQSEIPALKQNCLRFMQAVNAPVLNFDQLEDIFKHDVSLSTKLLRYLNSSGQGMSQRITSIKQALALLGERPLRKWGSLVGTASLGEDKPIELVITALIRARFCELLAPMIGLSGREFDLFLMGLLSTIDALTDQPLANIITQIPLPQDVTAALLGASNPFQRACGLAQAFERGISARLDAILLQLKLPLALASPLYRQAITWADASLHP